MILLQALMTLSFSIKNFFKLGRAEVATKEIICRKDFISRTEERDDGKQTCPMTSSEPSRADSNGWIGASCRTESATKCQH